MTSPDPGLTDAECMALYLFFHYSGDFYRLADHLGIRYGATKGILHRIYVKTGTSGKFDLWRWARAEDII